MAADYTVTVDSVTLAAPIAISVSEPSSSLAIFDPVNFAVSTDSLALPDPPGSGSGGGGGPTRPASGLVYPIYL